MAAPFEQAFDEFAQLQEEASKYTSESAPQGMKEGGEVRAIHYREEEAIYIKASFDRVTVIFSTVFREETDRIFGKVFLQEFVDARRRAIQNAPQVLFRNDPPLEIQGIPGVDTSGSADIGYITFGTSGKTVTRSIANDFSPVPSPSRNCSTSRSHLSHPDLPRLFPLPYQGLQGVHSFENAQEDSRFPSRYVDTSIACVCSSAHRTTVLRRARPESEEKERKTASGRTFKVQA